LEEKNMAVNPDNLMTKVFRRIERNDVGEISMDNQMLKILFEVDGQRTVQEIAAKLGMGPSDIANVISRLVDKGIIAPASVAISYLSPAVFAGLRKELAIAIGPIADVLLENALEDFNSNESSFPSEQAAELVDVLARQISRQEKRVAFQQRMLQLLRELSIDSHSCHGRDKEYPYYLFQMSAEKSFMEFDD